MTSEGNSDIRDHQVVSHEDWLAARMTFLKKEKEFTRLRDELNRARRELPWEAVEKEYVFDGPKGKQTLGDLFDARSQLIVYHFMFDPKAEAGCPHCSLRADGFNGIGVHMNHRDVTMVVVSRAPYGKLAAYEKRMGWNFKWVSSHDSDFNFDYHVSFTQEEFANKKAFYNFKIQDPQAPEREGHSVFYKDESGTVFHCYSCYDRGNDMLNTHYLYLDLVPKGRDEGGRGPFWVRRRDEYQG
jgi:predicted dithiol-disulfide oxidoreductase (DUF899 family)